MTPTPNSTLPGWTVTTTPSGYQVAGGYCPLPTPEGIVEQPYLDISLETLIDGLDQFYIDFANRKIFVVWALNILQLQLGGTEGVDGATRYFRCRAAVFGADLEPEERQRRLSQCTLSP